MVEFVIVKDWQWIVVLFKVLGENLSLPITTLKKRQFDQCKKSNIKSDEKVVISGTVDNRGAELNGPTAWHWSWRHLVRHISYLWEHTHDKQINTIHFNGLILIFPQNHHDKISPLHHQFSNKLLKRKKKNCKPANAAEAGFD